MELALAELALEEPQEVEEDVDFVVDKGVFLFYFSVSFGSCVAVGLEEEDVFEADFASTDEEAAQEDVDEEDRVVREEERRERKVRFALSLLRECPRSLTHPPPRPRARASKKPPQQLMHASE